MNREVFIVVRRDDATGTDIDYFNGSSFGDIATVELYSSKIEARVAAAQMQTQYQTNEIDYRQVTITINMGS